MEVEQIQRSHSLVVYNHKVLTPKFQVLQTQLGESRESPSFRFLTVLIVAPIRYELNQQLQREVDFHFFDGLVETTPAGGIAEQYEGPYLRYYKADAPHISQVGKIARRLSRESSSPENFARSMRNEGLMDVCSFDACNHLDQLLARNPTGYFDGIMGFSEGGSLAASLMLSRNNYVKSFKFAVFFCAMPPFYRERSGVILGDEDAERIDLPTAHIFGSKDVGRLASLALYNLCNSEKAYTFEHKAGHTIPWESTATLGMAGVIRATIDQCGIILSV